jgi:hypothetical protein
MAIGSNHGRELGLTNGQYPTQLALMKGRIHDIIWNFVDHFFANPHDDDDDDDL